MSSGAYKKGKFQSACVGSQVSDEHIEALLHRRLVPPANLVAARVPCTKAALTPERGEVVVFEEHFCRDFGLPASDFFARFLSFFSLQPLHLAPNAILQLLAFVVKCEGFIGAEQSGPKPMTPCGTVLVHHRMASGFPQLPLQDSVKMWQKGFFYLKNDDPAGDYINLPPFANAPSRRS
ncbi:hypothetical protein D1007_03146 [Hordeum vulgare]|nr:hypothetical protein D1007_03146 [Hordeum vulgare]